jgi:glycosyltransferase involved in cell wall biosynthesis
MRILHVTPAYIPAYRYGGPVRSVHELARQLVAEGEEVTVYTTTADVEAELPYSDGEEVVVDGVHIRYFHRKALGSFFYAPLMKQVLRECVRQFDLVHVHWMYCYTTTIACHTCRDQKVPYIVSPRGMLDTNAIRMRSGIKKKLYLNLIDRAGLGASTFLHYTSNGEKQNSYLRESGIPSCVLPNVVSFPSVDTVPWQDKDNHVLFLGRINYIKGLDLLMDAWSIVCDRIKDAKLIIAGPVSDSEGRQIRESFFRQFGTGSVDFIGMVRGEEKASLLANTRMLVMPSYLESFGNSILEAMGAGIPVIVTNRVNLAPEISASDAGLVVELSPTEIAEAICTLMIDDERAEALVSNGRSFVKEFLPGKVIPRYRALYKEAASVHG